MKNIRKFIRNIKICDVIMFTVIMFAILITCKVDSSGSGKVSEIIQPKLVEMTYYSYTGSTCANGKHPHVGVAAYKSEYIGMTAIIYSVSENGLPGEIIGYYEIYDTGYGRKESNGKGTIQNGNAIDIFMENNKVGKDFIEKYGNKVFIQIINAVG